MTTECEVIADATISQWLTKISDIDYTMLGWLEDKIMPEADRNEMMRREKMQKIIDFYGLGEVIAYFSLKKSGFLHNSYQCRTSQGLFHIKQYSKAELTRIEFSQQINCKFYDYNIPVIKSLISQNKKNFDTEREFFLVFTCQVGQVLSLNDIDQKKALMIAKILGKMHALKLTFSPRIVVLETKFDITIKELLWKYIDASLFEYYLKQFQDHCHFLEQQLILSHGDLIQTNVIWEDDNSPWLIDWDHAGYINQHLEVFNTAINWAGINTGKINLDIYREFLTSYQAESGFKPQIDQALIYAGLGSWLAWLIFNAKRIAGDLPATEWQLEHAKEQIRITRNALGLLTEQSADLYY